MTFFRLVRRLLGLDDSPRVSLSPAFPGGNRVIAEDLIVEDLIAEDLIGEDL